MYQGVALPTNLPSKKTPLNRRMNITTARALTITIVNLSIRNSPKNKLLSISKLEEPIKSNSNSYK
ncbi:Uncharacterised protein [Actinobacillus pleuropneumoniae]|nr:Uncharacterised protein [Actinobacillus pleuropneumoniae]